MSYDLERIYKSLLVKPTKDVLAVRMMSSRYEIILAFKFSIRGTIYQYFLDEQ